MEGKFRMSRTNTKFMKWSFSKSRNGAEMMLEGQEVQRSEPLY